jgi:rhamnose transport system substrate-binding protein
MINKSVLWILAMVVSVIMVFTFSLSGCAAEEVEEAEEAAEEVEEAEEAAEEVEEAEEVAEEVEEAEEEQHSPWYKGEGPFTLAWVPKGLGHPYFDSCYTGAKEAAAEFGDEIFEVGPEDWSVEGQVSVIESVIDQNVDAIGIAANDVDALAPVCKKAMEAGIPVIAWDAPVATDARVSFVNQASFEGVGRGLASAMGEAIDYEGKIAILSATPQAPNQAKWTSWVYEEFKDPKYEKVEIIDLVYGDDLPEKSYDKALGLIKTYPELKGILGLSAVAAPAACAAVIDKDVIGDIQVVGLAAPSQMEDYILKGACYKTGIWNTEDLGYVAATLMHKTCTGEFTGEVGETVEMGRPTYGEPDGIYEVIIGDEGDPYVLLGPLMFFDKSNVEEWAEIIY